MAEYLRLVQDGDGREVSSTASSSSFTTHLSALLLKARETNGDAVTAAEGPTGRSVLLTQYAEYAIDRAFSGDEPQPAITNQELFGDNGFHDIALLIMSDAVDADQALTPSNAIPTGEGENVIPFPLSESPTTPKPPSAA